MDWTSRKIWLSLIVIILGAVVDIFSKNGLSVNLAGLLGTALAVYCGVNVFEKTKTPTTTEAIVPQVDMAPLQNQVNELQKAVQTLVINQAELNKKIGV